MFQHCGENTEHVNSRTGNTQQSSNTHRGQHRNIQHVKPSTGPFFHAIDKTLRGTVVLLKQNLIKDLSCTRRETMIRFKMCGSVASITRLPLKLTRVHLQRAKKASVLLLAGGFVVGAARSFTKESTRWTSSFSAKLPTRQDTLFFAWSPCSRWKLFSARRRCVANHSKHPRRNLDPHVDDAVFGVCSNACFYASSATFFFLETQRTGGAEHHPSGFGLRESIRCGHL